MRKVCVVLLILAIAGGAFAQGFAFTGYFDGGVGAFIPDSGDAGLGMVTRDSDVGNGMRAQIQGAFTNEAKNAGINVRIRANGGVFGTSGDLNAFFPYAYGWIAPFDGKLNIKAGKVDDGTFGTGDALIDDDLGERGGFLAVVKPVDLLTLGFGAYTGAFNRQGIEAAKYTAGAVVNVPDIIKVTFQYANRGDAYIPESPTLDVDLSGTTPAFAIDTTDPVGVAAHRIWAAFNILGLNKLGLKLVVVGKMEQVQDFSDAGVIGIYETIGFTKIDNLSLNLNL
jgi:hypothetical protein